MKTHPLHSLAGIALASIVITAPLSFADDKAKEAAEPNKSEAKSDKPEAAPGWIVIEEDFWIPWRYNASDSLHNAEVHYRSGEEKAAARELKSAASWLAFAATHAQPITKEKLASAMITLENLAKDLIAGKAITARQLDGAMAAQIMP